MSLHVDDVIFVADDIVFFVTDAACEMNFDGFWRHHGDDQAILRNCRRLEMNDEVVLMTLVLPGTHRLRFLTGTSARLTPPNNLDLWNEVEPSELQHPAADPNEPGPPTVRFVERGALEHPYVDAYELVLPTGRVVVRSEGPDALLVYATTVPPGTYYVSVEWDVGQESLHHCIERVEDYPAGDGPDGIITLVRKGSVRQSTIRR